jgi:CheY-like chemotaxis protein
VSSQDRQNAPLSSSAEEQEDYAGALHEVSNALTVVLGWLDMAARADNLDDAREAISVAREHARRGQSMARQSIGGEVPSGQRARLASEVATFAAQSVAPKADRASVRILTQLGGGTDIRVESDSSILQILTNLLLNAIDFAPPGSAIRLTAERAPQGIIYRVIDDGPGVPSSALSDLFVAPTSMREGGVGIGLPYSRKLAREHDGELRYVLPAESGTKGACFELSWPRAHSSQVAPGPSQAIRDALSGRRILLIEDDLSISSLIELTFEAHGAEVLSLATADQVEEALRGRPLFDIALLDLSPVRETLCATLTRMKELSPAAPVILMSGEPSGVPQEAEGRFASWVRKPFDLDQLLSTVGKLIINQG